MVDDVRMRGALDFDGEVVGARELSAADGDGIPGEAGFATVGDGGLLREEKVGFFVFVAFGVEEGEEVLEIIMHGERR